MQDDFSDALEEIANDLRRLEEPFRDKFWEPLGEYAAEAEIVIKGRKCDLAQCGKLLSVHTAGVRKMEVVLEEILDRKAGPARVELQVRVAALGRRVDDDQPDGVILDGRLIFVRRDGRWHLRELSIDCPPEWAQWNSRPNSQAPIHYGDPLWWKQRSAK